MIEGAANGTAVGVTAAANDVDTIDSVTFSLDDDAGGRFAIDSVSGVVTVANGALLDREAAASHDIVVRALSSDGTSSVALFTIAIGDVDEYDVSPDRRRRRGARHGGRERGGRYGRGDHRVGHRRRRHHQRDHLQPRRRRRRALRDRQPDRGGDRRRRHRLRDHQQPGYHGACRECGRQLADPRVHHRGVRRQRRAGERRQRCERNVESGGRERGCGYRRGHHGAGDGPGDRGYGDATRSTTTPAGASRSIR